MTDTANHKPSERHTVDEVLKSLQDLIRNEALEDGKPKAAAPAPADPGVPRKRGRPRKVVIPDAAAPAQPRRRSSTNLTEELNSVLASLNDLVNLDVGTSPAPAKTAAAPAAPESLKPISSDLQAAAEALAFIDDTEAEPLNTDAADTLSFEDMAESAEEISAAPPPEEIIAAPPPEEPAIRTIKPEAKKPVPAATTPAPKQMELKVIEPGEWKESEPDATPATPEKPAARPPATPPAAAPVKKESRPAAKPAKPDKPAARAPAATPAPAPTRKKSETAAAPAKTDKPPAQKSPTVAPAPSTRAPPISAADEETIELGDTDAITDLVVSDGPTTGVTSSAVPASTPPAPDAKPAEEMEMELELTLEDPTRRSLPAPAVIDHEREKELHKLGLAEIDFSQVPEASSEHFAAFANSALSSGHDHAVGFEPDGGGQKASPPAPGRSAPLALDDNIPLLEDEVTLHPPAPGLDPRQTRELAVRAIARLNIEMRKAGEQGLDIKTIQRLQALLREELEKAGTTGENTRPKN